jgi:GntR family transcriptional regulator/MocR family aminotransferase
VDRSRDLFLPSIILDRAASAPLHQQLRHQFARAIRSGTADGRRLPSTRLLARLAGVSRNTVLAAYDDLAADGLIRGRRGAGMLIVAGANRGRVALDLQRLLREAQYPARSMTVIDPDGTTLYLTY